MGALRVTEAELLDRHFFDDYGKPFPREDTPRILRKFQEITGIRERRHAAPGQRASDLALEAARAALDSARLDPEELDGIILAHNMGDLREPGAGPDQVPAVSARLKAALGIANPDCLAFDLGMACCGWLQGLILAHGQLRLGEARRILVVGAETLSRVSDPADRDSLLYGDGAGAVVLEAREGAEGEGVLAHAGRSDAVEGLDYFRMAAAFDSDGPLAPGPMTLKMQGRKVFEYALAKVPGVARRCVEAAGLAPGDIHKVLFHQANGKMLDAILKRFYQGYGNDGPPAGIMPMSLPLLGNSSVGTIPTLLDMLVRGRLEGHQVEEGGVLLMVAVGAGMSVNALCYRWPRG